MSAEHPITEICIISDKGRCPPNFTVVSRAFDDSSFDGDLWKDSLFSFSRIYRYVCFSKSVPVNCYTCNVIAEIALVNDKEHVPTGFTPIDYTMDTKLISLVIILIYETAVLHFSFSSYPALPYPIHPLTHGSNFGLSTPTRTAPQPPVANNQSAQLDRFQSTNEYGRQTSLSSSVHSTGIEGLPFELNPRIKSAKDKKMLPIIKPLSLDEFDYDFSIESTVLVDGFS